MKKKLIKKSKIKYDKNMVKLYNSSEGNNCKCNAGKDNCNCGYAS